MKIGSINHILRSAAAITNHRTFVLVGSAAVIARLRGHVPGQMTLSDEVDIYALDAPNAEELSDLIDGSIGQDSPFHSTFGYYADGVSPETSKMPSDWMERANKYESAEAPGVLAIVPEENDIALAKLVAWREKDIHWLKDGVAAGVLSPDKMKARLSLMPAADLEKGMPEIQIMRDRLLILGSPR
ncbi:MAG: hypothetical protein K2Y27_17250 [Xanthobacteraceae bacterium]|nr:hypothetical protein [Xanthobacteraceae bacterium]